MLQLTKIERVYVPVSVKDELPECDSQHNLTFLSKTVAILTDEGLNATEYYTKIDSSHKLVDKGWNHQGDFNEITHWLKEQNNKYILSEEELVLFKRQWALEVLNKAKDTDINTAWLNIKRELQSEFENNNT
jgi:hypothetical protein